MFAVVRTGGKQYRVHPGDKIVVEKLAGNAGDQVTLGDVLIAGEGSDFRNVDGLTIAAEIVAQAKGEKVTVFKKRRRHNYRRKKGHRQQHTILKILSIGDEKAPKKASASKSDSSKADAKQQSQAPAGPVAAAAKGKKAGTAKSSSEPAEVNATPTENPAPSNEAQANPAAESTDAPSKASKAAASKDKPTAKTPSTKNAAPAKGGSKKAPKAK